MCDCVWLCVCDCVCVTVCDCVWLCGWEGKSHVTLVCDVTEWMRGWWVMDDERWWVLCAEKWWEVMRSGGWLMRSDGWVVGEWWKTQKRNSSTRGSQVVTYPSTRLAWGGLTSRSGTRSGANRLVWPELIIVGWEALYREYEKREYLLYRDILFYILYIL